MSRLPKLSGERVIKVLVNDFGFSAVRQKGSHVILRKFVDGRKVVTVVPLHKEIKLGTLIGILELAHVDQQEFLSKL